MRSRTFGLWCGVAGPVIWLVLIAATGLVQPDFSHVTDFVSELAARGTRTEIAMRFGFVASGVLFAVFAAAARTMVPRTRLSMTAAALLALDGAGRVGAGVFPCDPGCVHVSPGPDLHKLFAIVGFGSGILAAVAWGFVLRRVPESRPVSALATTSGVVALAALLLMTGVPPSPVPAGLLEHLATVVLTAWVLVFAVALLRVSANPFAAR